MLFLQEMSTYLWGNGHFSRRQKQTMGYHQESMTGSNVWISKDTFSRLQKRSFYIFNGNNLQPPPKLRVLRCYLEGIWWQWCHEHVHCTHSKLQSYHCSQRTCLRDIWSPDRPDSVTRNLKWNLKGQEVWETERVYWKLAKPSVFVKGNSWKNTSWIVQLKCFTRFLKQFIVQ